MGELKEAKEEINEWIDNVTGFAGTGLNILFSPVNENDVIQAEMELKRCKVVCRLIRIIVFLICVTIIYFHLKG